MIHIDIHNEQHFLPIDEPRLRSAIELVFGRSGVDEALVSLAVVDDAAIHKINRQFLDHDEPTDVISFVLDERPDFLEGEIVVSAETAVRQAAALGWPADDELLLYAIHGALHLVGYDDLEPTARAEMRRQEHSCLAAFGLTPRCDEPTANELG